METTPWTLFLIKSADNDETRNDSMNEGLAYMKLDYLEDKARNRKVTKKLDVRYKVPTARTKLRVFPNRYRGRIKMTTFLSWAF